MPRSTSLRTIVLLDDSLPKILSFYSYFNQSNYSQIYNSFVNVWKIYWRSGFPSGCAGFLADAQDRSFRFYNGKEANNFWASILDWVNWLAGNFYDCIPSFWTWWSWCPGSNTVPWFMISIVIFKCGTSQYQLTQPITHLTFHKKMLFIRTIEFPVVAFTSSIFFGHGSPCTVYSEKFHWLCA